MQGCSLPLFTLPRKARCCGNNKLPVPVRLVGRSVGVKQLGGDFRRKAVGLVYGLVTRLEYYHYC